MPLRASLVQPRFTNMTQNLGVVLVTPRHRLAGAHVAGPGRTR
jgi:hypothetical protein